MNIKNIIFVLFFTAGILSAQELTKSALKAIGAPNNPKVEVVWNRYYDWQGVSEIVHKLADAHPEICKVESIGKSYLGKDLWELTITNPETGSPESKPAFYIDASIHANEIQAVEVALYTAWFLVESYPENEFIKGLLDRLTFYIVPFQSPDSRDKFLNESLVLRSGAVPRDDDGDGLFDEDGPEDINGDGQITQMRIKTPTGRWKTDPDDPRLMVRCEPDEQGEYELFWSEGIDNDGDGEINEDSFGYYDPNRNWGWFWRPNYVQYGADRFPFNLPETKAISDFIKAHKNILASQSFHNSGGMILRGPGAKEDKNYRADDRLFDFIGKTGEKILPGYNYMITYKDLYTVYGGETDWQYSGLGIMPYVNELFTSYNFFRKEIKGDYNERRKAQYEFDKLLLFGESVVDWTEVDHPQFGKVEVGGVKRQFGRMPPSFLLEEECHRNMAFVLFQASNLPEIEITKAGFKKLGDGINELTIAVTNKKPIPTRLAVDVENNINRPDWVTLEGKKVISGGTKNSIFDEEFTEQKFNPNRISIDRIDGNSTVYVSWLIKGNGPFKIKFDSMKGGKFSKTIE